VIQSYPAVAGAAPVPAVRRPPRPEQLGDPTFGPAHGTRFAYVAGEMANGIASTEMVIALAEADMLGFFGSAGLTIAQVEAAVDRLRTALPDRANWGVNLIHTPQDPAWEERLTDLVLRRRVREVSASAFMEVTPSVVRLAVSGLDTAPDGSIVRRTNLFAKLSRPELAEMFLRPAPPGILAALRAADLITEREAGLAARIPLAEDITVEADSGGHTDNRPLLSLLPRVLEQRRRSADRLRHGRVVRIGAAGGLGTPHAVAGAFATGADYVLTGSVNQTCVQADVSADAKALLSQADIADVAMAPAADMFELGVQVQVLRRGTQFAARANQLYRLYRQHDSLESIPADVVAKLERTVFSGTLAAEWVETRAYWSGRDRTELDRAESDPKHRMALVFRRYLGRSSGWAIDGETSRRRDYQLWCGPALGSFNQWVQGTFLADPADRDVVQVARNLMYGAAELTRVNHLRAAGDPVPVDAFGITPRRFT
jgi:trans-AT polyketide synthase, acyltransferase and oxidoreductase domains